MLIRSVTRKFLKIEKSMSKSPGPTIWFRPRLPIKFWQGTGPEVGVGIPNELGSHSDAMDCGTVGTVKQFVLRYCRPFGPACFQFELMGLHPGTRFT